MPLEDENELPDPTRSQFTHALPRSRSFFYRNESSEIHYALVKRHGKQFRRSLKASDRQLAGRRLAEFREKVTRLSRTKHAGTLTFE